MTFKCQSRSSNVVPIENSFMSCLVVHSNFRCVTHCFQDTSCFNGENHIFAYPTCIWPWIWMSCRWSVETKFCARKLESWGCHMTEITIVGRTMWTQSTTVTDGWTDITDIRWLRPLCITSHSRNQLTSLRPHSPRGTESWPRAIGVNTRGDASPQKSQWGAPMLFVPPDFGQ